MSDFHNLVVPDKVSLPAAPKPPSWRDNKTVLWLVRIGFVLQFYIPAIVCLLIIWDTGTNVPKVVPEDDPLYIDYVFAKGINADLFKFSIYTLILLTVQCTIFTLILRVVKSHVDNTLVWLISINIIHSLIWCFMMWPLTLIRLAIPTILYFIAVCIESGKSNNARQTDTQADTP